MRSLKRKCNNNNFWIIEKNFSLFLFRSLKIRKYNINNFWIIKITFIIPVSVSFGFHNSERRKCSNNKFWMLGLSHYSCVCLMWTILFSLLYITKASASRISSSISSSVSCSKILGFSVLFN